MDRLLTPAEVAEAFQNTEKTLKNWRCSGIGPPYLKLENGSVRYRPGDVEEWLGSQIVQPSVTGRSALAIDAAERPTAFVEPSTRSRTA